MASGGYRAPSQPAAVSGPGALSARTDGGPGSQAMVRQLSGGSYGDRKDFAQIQSGADMAPAQEGSGALPPVTPESAGLVGFDADSARPGEPVTSGAASGDGLGMEALGLASDPMQDSANHWAAHLPTLERMSNLPNSDPAFRQLILRLKARTGM